MAWLNLLKSCIGNFMKEKEYLSQLGFLITKTQYKTILLKICVILTISVLVCLSGMILMLATSNRTLLFIGLIIFVLGGFLLIFDSFFLVIKYAAKIQLYRHYKKHPEDFETDVEPT